MNAAILIVALAMGQAPETRYRVERAEPKATYQVERVYDVERVPVKPIRMPTWPEAVARAKSTGRPLVVGVGVVAPWWTPEAPDFWDAIKVDELPGFAWGDVAVWTPSGGWLWHVATFKAGVDAAVVLKALRDWRAPVSEESQGVREGVMAVPRPFSVQGSLYSVEREPTADGDAATGPWRWSDADVPEYMRRYTPARYTQEIAVTDGRDRISAVPRSRLEAKWRVPGGLVGIKGWASELWQWAPRRYWVGDIAVWNGSNFQNNRGHKVSYEPGTEFLDVLRNTGSGEVFEVRKAMKTDKGWQRFVTYRNAAERPRGYHGSKGLNCHSCHNEAGSGSYSAGLVPGGDTVLSFPLDHLE